MIYFGLQAANLSIIYSSKPAKNIFTEATTDASVRGNQEETLSGIFSKASLKRKRQTNMASSELADKEKTQTNEGNDNKEPNEEAEDIINLVATRKLGDLKPKFMYNCLLVGVLILYGLLGGFIFKTFEAAPIGFEDKTETLKASPNAEELLNELLKDQNKKTESFDEEWRRFAIAKIDEFVNMKTNAGQVENPVEWSFADSWLFACTIFTTIGYGNIAPLSIKGRLFCMLFATIGIPLFSVVAGSLASFITDFAITLHAEYHRRKRRAQSAQQKKDDTISPDLEGEVPELEITLKHVAMGCFGYLCLGSLFFSLGEGWSLFESLYYCFITLSTVGLGDYVPGHVHHTSLFGMYILFGLVLLIMLFGALEEVITKHCLVHRFNKDEQILHGLNVMASLKEKNN